MPGNVRCFHFLSTSFILNVELGCLVADQGEVPVPASPKVHSLFLTTIELEVGYILFVLTFGGYDLDELHFYSREKLSI